MEKKKRWQFFLILGVLLLTVYNILPTLFYYSKPLKSEIDEKKSQAISAAISTRINKLELQSVAWLSSFCNLLQIKPSSIELSDESPDLVAIKFSSKSDAEMFAHFLPRAGALIPFAPSQLSVHSKEQSDTVIIKRKIPIHINQGDLSTFFQFSYKYGKDGTIEPLYKALVFDRLLELALALGGAGENTQITQTLINTNDESLREELALQLSQNLNSFINIYGISGETPKRFFGSFLQNDEGQKEESLKKLLNQLDLAKDSISAAKKNLLAEKNNPVNEQKIILLSSREKNLEATSNYIKRNQSLFTQTKTPWNYTTAAQAIQKNIGSTSNISGQQTLDLEGKNPFFEKVTIDWQNQKIIINVFSEVQSKLDQLGSDYTKYQQAEQFLFNQLAYVNRVCGEEIKDKNKNYEILLSELEESKSILAFRLGAIAAAQTQELKKNLELNWNPTHPDFKAESFPIWDYETYQSLPTDQKKLGLLIYSPVLQSKSPEIGFRMNSMYVIARGLERIVKKYEQVKDSDQAQIFLQDFYKLNSILQKSGFSGFLGSEYPLNRDFKDDYIFESSDYFNAVLMASRENFQVKGTKRYAILELSDVEQRILTDNKIDDSIHEDLLKWRDEYRNSYNKTRGSSKFDVPKPTESAFFSNIALSFKKYFRGDDRKILHWGLDLSGGKTVQIELRDNNNRIVSNEADIKQGINELYTRVNKMGVSEVSIRQEGNYITLDFPGSQGVSATDLVKASSMYFHIVNEKFSTSNKLLSDAVNRFLQDVWNEAVVTNKKSIEDINLIAWKQIYGDSLDPDVAQARSEAGRILHQSGLRLADPINGTTSNTLNQKNSKIALLRGSDYTQWQGQTHPLIIVFNNYALEGSNLENVRASYDPSKGNFLSFEIKSSSSDNYGVKTNPRNDLAAWTSMYAKDKVNGSSIESYTNGRGWRMAVILNGTIVSAPTLESAIKDSGMISGSFSQREINQLEADLKAGSLSFTPKILSEKNVSPELGSQERFLGIVATVIALFLVIGCMIGYYRLGGVVASIAVIFNLLIMWATLQNIQATLTLPMIAGLILTLGMAVDANVLVFERIREEFSISGRIGSAIQCGYKKAFSAIVDSNVTTIIAGLVLLHFDSGPIKGFALTLIIGIVSSMFTALFMTRFFFSEWIKNPNNKKLNMLNLFKCKNFDFLKYTKSSAILSSIVIVIGSIVFIAQKSTIMGMDFTGGYTLNLEITPGNSSNYRESIEKALVNSGLTAQEFQIRELTPSNNIRLFLSKSLDQNGNVFYNLENKSNLVAAGLIYQNPKVSWIITSLQNNGIILTKNCLKNIDSSWAEVSGQMSETMRNNAIFGIVLAMIGILVYITIRFEFKYAISATICLAHDILFTVAVLAILHALNVPLQIDLNIIAALMTIVGYSLNDTIIVFDRIREDVRLMKNRKFTDIINHSLNVTLSRTLMTSGTTLLVLLPLIALGGSTILGFSLVMAIGVIFGTLSSLFVAAPLMLLFHKREIAKDKTEVTILTS